MNWLFGYWRAESSETKQTVVCYDDEFSELRQILELHDTKLRNLAREVTQLSLRLAPRIKLE